MVYKGPEVHHGFLTSKLDAYEWSYSRPGRVNLEANLRYPLSGTLGGPRAGLDVMEKETYFLRMSGMEPRTVL